MPGVANKIGFLFRDLKKQVGLDKIAMISRPDGWMLAVPVPSKNLEGDLSKPFYCHSSGRVMKICDKFPLGSMTNTECPNIAPYNCQSFN